MFVIENCDPSLHHAHVTYLLDFLLLMVPICASLSKLQVNLHILKMLLDLSKSKNLDENGNRLLNST